MIAAGLATGTLLAMGLVGCGKAVTGTPEAASTPTTTTAPKPTGGGSGSTQGDRFCSTITSDMVQQAFGVSGAQITTGQSQDTNGVAAVSCTIVASGGAATLGGDVIAFNFAGQTNVTTQSALQNAQTQLQSTGSASNFQTQNGIGDADAAFSYTFTANGGNGFGVYATKELQGSVVGTDVVVVGQVQLPQVVKFAGLVDTD
jgi:hypothetical protein